VRPELTDTEIGGEHRFYNGFQTATATFRVRTEDLKTIKLHLTYIDKFKEDCIQKGHLAVFDKLDAPVAGEQLPDLASRPALKGE
jgi:hypothetical protein